MDNPFVTPTAGQADWDASLNADLGVLERGYHVTERAGVAINTGNVLWLNSGGFFFPFDPNSATVYPHAIAYTAAASGDSLAGLAWGIVRSLGINSPAFPGKPLYVSALTPGLIVTTPNGPRVGRGLAGYGVLFQPQFGPHRLSQMIDVVTTGLADTKVLAWSDSSSKWTPQNAGAGGSSALASLTDVDTTGVTNGKVLAWSDTSSKWVPTSASAGGGATAPHGIYMPEINPNAADTWAAGDVILQCISVKSGAVIPGAGLLVRSGDGTSKWAVGLYQGDYTGPTSLITTGNTVTGFTAGVFNYSAFTTAFTATADKILWVGAYCDTAVALWTGGGRRQVFWAGSLSNPAPSVSFNTNGAQTAAVVT